MPARKCSVVTANDPGPGALPDSHAAALPEMLQYEVPCKIYHGALRIPMLQVGILYIRLSAVLSSI
jgi:hypothetical protein